MMGKFRKAGAWAAWGVAIGALALAAMYKIRADRLSERWRDVQMEVERLQTVPPASSPVLDAAPAPVPELDGKTAEAVADRRASHLEERIRELETALVEKDRALWELRDSPPPPPAEVRPPPGRRDWMEQLRRSDPARYEQIQNQREERGRQVAEGFARKAAYFLQRDTSTMNQAERESHTLMLQLLDEAWRLTERIREEASPEERRDLRQALREKAELLNPLLLQERTRAFTEAGREAGYNDEEAARFAVYLQAVIELTSPRGLFGGGPPGGRGFP